jgi:Flp pilus assembly protein TadG
MALRPGDLMRRLRRFVLDDGGNAMVEFALVTSLVFIPLVFGVIEFGRLVWAKDMITSAAREGVRYAIVHGTFCDAAGCPLADSAAVADTVIARTKLSPIVVSTQWLHNKIPGDTVTVTVSYVYTPIMKVPALVSAKTITAKSRQVVVY